MKKVSAMILVSLFTGSAFAAPSIPKGSLPWPIASAGLADVTILHGLADSAGYDLRLCNGIPPFHYGVDIAAPTGSRVFAVATGRVARISNWGGSFGSAIAIESSSGGKVWTAIYGHLNAEWVDRNGRQRKLNDLNGLSVKAGDEIGSLISQSDFGDVPHLHFGIRDGAVAGATYPAVGAICGKEPGTYGYMNPLDYLSGTNGLQILDNSDSSGVSWIPSSAWSVPSDKVWFFSGWD